MQVNNLLPNIDPSTQQQWKVVHQLDNFKWKGYKFHLNFETAQTIIMWKIMTLGQGKFGKVFLVTSDPNNFFAIKKIKILNTDILNTFLAEFQLGKQLNHPNVMKIFSYHVQERIGYSSGYLLMEYIDGLTLGKYLENNYLPKIQRYQLIIQCLNLWLDLFKKNFIHIDPSLSNVMITKSGQVKLIDIGACVLRQEASPWLINEFFKRMRPFICSIYNYWNDMPKENLNMVPQEFISQDITTEQANNYRSFSDAESYVKRLSHFFIEIYNIEKEFEGLMNFHQQAVYRFMLSVLSARSDQN